jgi:hypothetical protein
MVFEGPVIPRPHSCPPSFRFPRRVIDSFDAHARINTQAPEVDLEQHGPSQERLTGIVKSTHKAGVDEFVGFR